MDLIDLGERVRRERRAAGITQQELAQKSGVSRLRIVQFENGQVFDMKFGTVMQILEAVGMTLALDRPRSARPTLDDIRKEQEDETPGLGR